MNRTVLLEIQREQKRSPQLIHARVHTGKVYKTPSYLPISMASCTVSGIRRLRVSGRQKRSMQTTMEGTPKMIRGIALPPSPPSSCTDTENQVNSQSNQLDTFTGYLHEDVPLLDFRYLVFTRVPDESYHRRFGFLSSCSCYVVQAKLTPFVDSTLHSSTD